MATRRESPREPEGHLNFVFWSWWVFWFGSIGPSYLYILAVEIETKREIKEEGEETGDNENDRDREIDIYKESR